jgi:hypothetical protein
MVCGVVSENFAAFVFTEDGGIQVLQNVGILPQHYTVLQPVIPLLEFSLL